MMYKQLCVVLLIAFFTDISATFAKTNVGNGTLNVTETVRLQGSNAVNFMVSPVLIVGKYASYPNKRSLLRFEDIRGVCTTVNHAAMYLFYYSSYKVIKIPVSVDSRTIQAHRVLKYWREAEAIL